MYYMYFNNVDLPDALHLKFVRQKVQRAIQKTIKLGKLIFTNNLIFNVTVILSQKLQGLSRNIQYKNLQYMKCPRDLIKMQAQLKVE